MLKTELSLATKDLAANIAVKNLAVARNFYGNTLGLTPVDSREQEVLVYKCGQSTLMVYESKFAGTNKATAATWTAGGDIEAIVQALKAKGVQFEHYDLPGMKQEGDLHVADRMKAAWLKDPDGNILALVSG